MDMTFFYVDESQEGDRAAYSVIKKTVLGNVSIATFLNKEDAELFALAKLEGKHEE